MKDGKWTYQSEVGTIAREEDYKKGKLHGTTTLYYPSTKVLSVANYRYGRPDGNWYYYSSKGTLEKKMVFKNGLKVKQE